MAVFVRIEPHLKRALDREAFEKETDKTDLLSTILAERYGLDYTRNPRATRTTPTGGGPRPAG